MSILERDLHRDIEPVQRRVGYDLDDCALWREVLTRYFGHAKDVILRPSLPKKTLDDIPKLNHNPVDLSIKGPMETISAFFHFRRTAIPGVAELLREEIAIGTPVYAISGRRATKPWLDMTEAQLIRENIPISNKNIYLTPKGSSSLESKADCIRELGITEVIEDNKRTALYLAKLFPHVRIDYIDHGLTHLTEKDLAENPNITVIPIEEVARVKGVSEGWSTVRNSEYRKHADFADGVVKWLHEKSGRRLKAWHLTALGVGFSILGIGLAEHQNRTGNHSVRTTVLAFLSSFFGAALDVGDGKKARLERSEMTDQKAIEEDEERGGAIDAAGDGIIEAWQAGSAAFTAAEYGDAFSTKMALRRMRTVNLPRLAKAAVGCFGIKVPETYRISGILHGDIRFFGTSLGRKIPNYIATLVNRVGGVPVQGALDVIATTANVIVAAERFGALINPKGERALSEKEMRQAKIRLAVLGAETLASWGASWLLKRYLLGEIDKKHKK